MMQRWGALYARRGVRRRPAFRAEPRSLEPRWRSGHVVRTLADKAETTASSKKWDYYACRWREVAARLSPWVLMRRVRVPSDRIIKCRRFFIKHSYPWLAYSVPIASMMIAADILAQLLYPKRCDVLKSFDTMSTLKYALLATLIVGPLMSKYDLFTMRKLPCRKMYKLIMGKMILDTVVLIPFLLFVTMLLYDYQYLWCQTRSVVRSLMPGSGDQQCSCSFTSALARIYCRYEVPFLKIMTINIMTRPLALLLLCCLVPQRVRRPLRTLYEILFLTQASGILRYHLLGLDSTQLQQVKCCLRMEKGETKPVIKEPEPRHSKCCQYLSRVFGCICSNSNVSSTKPMKASK